MDAEIAHGIRPVRHEENIVELPVDGLLQLRLETENGRPILKHVQKLLEFVGQPRHLPGQVKLDNQPSAGLPRRILGLVQHIGGDHKNIQSLQ